jgi:hypothetical protein
VHGGASCSVSRVALGRHRRRRRYVVRKRSNCGRGCDPPLVALCALLFRFPVPFAGYLTGPSAIVPALMSLLFYGVFFGGFVVQALLGGVGGLLAEYIGAPNRRTIARLCIVFSSIGASVGVVTLAVLDKIIGPW